MKHFAKFLLIFSLVAVAMALGYSASAQVQENSHRFPETGKTVPDKFFNYWEAHGGLAQQGYPISDVLQERSDTDGKTYRVQYFERAVFEGHPENTPPYDVLLSLLGDFRLKEKYPNGAPPQQPNTSPGAVLFPETGKHLGGPFLDYWNSHGGLAQQGYPVTDEFTEVSDLDGKMYRVQYFERAVFELHPENAPPYNVLLSQLGAFRYRAKYQAGVTPVVTARPGSSTPQPTGTAQADGQANCANTSTGFVPLTDLVGGMYKGRAGGLYPGGNSPPPAYLQQGLQSASAIRPLSANGQSDDTNGTIGLLSIGMSNATQEWQGFIRAALADPQRSPRLAIVDGAEGGEDAEAIKDPGAQYWQFVAQRLQQAHVAASQVQAVWLKEAIARENRPFPQDADALRDDLAAITQILRQRFPNLRLIYLASRTYAGYATVQLNPEPYAYESGYAVKGLIEQNINSAIAGPWVAWGPYLWTDGLRERSDGLTWTCGDVRADGTHPSDNGVKKVADMLLTFFKTDPTAHSWFLGLTGVLPADN